MKKTLLSLIVAFAVSALQAQWVNDPATNTKLATTHTTVSDVMLSTNESTGDTYILWYANGLNLQRIDVNGVPQWGDTGIHIESHEFLSYSSGIDITTTADNAVVVGFSDSKGECFAMKFDKDGNAIWGEQGVSVFGLPQDNSPYSQVQLQAGPDGSVWIMAADNENLHLRYSNPYGTLNTAATISSPGYKCQNARMTPGSEGVVFVTYEKYSSDAFEADKEIWVEGFVLDGVPASTPAQLMEKKVYGLTYTHNAISDGIGGGYAYTNCPDSIGFNTFVFHFDANGLSTISEPFGIAVHTPGLGLNFQEAHATIDPETHDIILVYVQNTSKLLMNRISMTGEVLWGEGITIAEDAVFKNPMIHTYPDGSGFMVAYEYGLNTDEARIEASGFNMDGNQTWHTQMNSVLDKKELNGKTTGFHNGQNIIAWANRSTGNIYGQNIDMNGKMGPTSVNENVSSLSANIFQNGNSLIVSCEDLSQVEIISITGQSIKTVKANGNAAEINVSDLTRGLYIIRMNDANGNVMVKKTVIR